MYIKRRPLGQGNLRFGKPRRRRSLGFLIVYLVILTAALLVLWRLEDIQPRVLSALGPEPTPTLAAVTLVEMGDSAYASGDILEAVEYYRQAVQLEPSNLDLLFTLSRTLLLTQDSAYYEEALSVAEQAILAAPEEPDGYAIKARILDWMGDYDQAVIEALRAIDLDPTYALGHAYLAEAYADLGQLREAREQVELAIQLDPYSVDARRNYAYVLEFYGDYGGAVQQYELALQLDPQLLDLWYGVARNYRGMSAQAGTELGAEELFAKAVDTFSQIIMRTPEDPLPYVELGRTYFEVREDDSAQNYLEQAMRLVCEECPLHSFNQIVAAGYEVPVTEVPENLYPPAWIRLGQVYHTRRNYEDAIAVYEELLAWSEANGEEPPLEAYLVTGSDYYYLDMCDIAIPRVQEALSIYEERRMDDADALNSILSVFVLCRDWANTPPTIAFEFPAGYEEPDVYLESTSTDTSED